MLPLYKLLVSAISWCVLIPWYTIQAVGKHSSLEELKEWLGYPPKIDGGGERRILIHAVSVGEVMSTKALLDGISRSNFDVDLILTTGNKLGRELAEKMRRRYPLIKKVSYLPWDRARAVRSWLAQMAPDVVVVVETEIWPNFFFACQELRVPICIVNGRIKEEDYRRYRLARGFFRRVLECVNWIGVIDECELERFVGIGAMADRVVVVGDLKCDTAFLNTGTGSPVLERDQSDSLLLVAGSTHPPEEAVILDLVLGLKKRMPGLRVALAPRHLKQVRSIEVEAERLGFRVVRFSDSKQLVNRWDVLILDEIGELSTLYSQADLVLIGGSFSGHGGHNFMEAAAYARPILTGPDMRHFKDLAEYFQRNGGLERVDSLSDLGSALRVFLESQERRSRLGKRAYELLQRKRGAAETYVARIVGLAESNK